MFFDNNNSYDEIMNGADKLANAQTTQKSGGFWSKLWNKTTNAANKTWDAAKTSTNAQGQETLGGLNLINTGLNAANMIGGMVLANNQLKLAKEQAARDEQQRQLENKRYNEQVARNKQATDDTANTASSLQSAKANISSAEPLPTQRV